MKSWPAGRQGSSSLGSTQLTRPLACGPGSLEGPRRSPETPRGPSRCRVTGPPSGTNGMGAGAVTVWRWRPFPGAGRLVGAEGQRKGPEVPRGLTDKDPAGSVSWKLRWPSGSEVTTASTPTTASFPEGALGLAQVRVSQLPSLPWARSLCQAGVSRNALTAWGVPEPFSVRHVSQQREKDGKDRTLKGWAPLTRCSCHLGAWQGWEGRVSSSASDLGDRVSLAVGF